ncbi:META domain-containing protein [Flavobacteriaceae bacterium D16]|nr:META domain-containing protein [Flavobacteriaceae bacterium D16]
MKHITLLFIAILILASCANKKEQVSTFWISGFKVSCDAGAGKSNCLLINKSDELKDDSWELFYSDIEGFGFRQGDLKKVEILIEQPEDGALASDVSKMKYTLIKELEEITDPRAALAVNWQLEELNGTVINERIIHPTLTFSLLEMEIHGNGGCNSYNGTITKLGLNSIAFGDLIKTLKMCAEDTVEEEYLNALSKVSFFEIENTRLTFYNKEEKPVLIFKEPTKPDNKVRLHDIWSVVRMGGHPINSMVTIPRLEINTSDMKIYGNDGCNEYFGTVNMLTENNISFGNIGSTRKMCPDMEIPQRYNNALSKVNSYVFDEQVLVFTDEEGKEILALLPL